MQRLRFFLCLAACLLPVLRGYAQADITPAKIGVNLQAAIKADPQGTYPVNILLADQVDVLALHRDFQQKRSPLADRGYTVVTQLQAKAEATQGPLLAYLKQAPGASAIQPFWITNLVMARVDAATANGLALRSEVAGIYLDLPLEPMKAVSRAHAAPKSVAGHEPGHDLIEAPAVWARGYTGAGRKVLIIDSGVQGEHPALSRNFHGHYVPVDEAWFDANGSEFPKDCDLGVHGSAVTGCVLGLDRISNDTIGVAFNAEWMGAPAITESGDGCGNQFSVAAMQWALDPDNNPATSDDRPDFVNASFGLDFDNMTPQQCTGLWSQTLTALEAAGIGVVFAAGNDGDQGASTIGVQAAIANGLVNSFSVGSINPNSLQWSSFSSQGPTICADSGALAIKPEVTAPGEQVRTAGLTGYQSIMGTSFSAPYVTGALLLLKEAFPTLSGEDLKLAIYFSAVDLGPVGEDNKYGNGLVNVDAAFNYLVNLGHTPQAIPQTQNALLVDVLGVFAQNCDPAITPRALIRNQSASPMTSAVIEYRYSDGTTGSFNWSGNLAEGQEELVALPATTLPNGQYEVVVEITQVNGQPDYYYVDNRLSRTFTVRPEENTEIPVTTACIGAVSLLAAVPDSTNRIIRWYDAPVFGNLLDEGPILMVQPLVADRTFYADVLRKDRVGMSDPFDGNTFPAFSSSSFLEFDVFSTITINSVKVYTDQPGMRTIQVVRPSDGFLLISRQVSIPQGGSRINLGVIVPPGEGYQMKVSGNLNQLYSTLTNFSFPYEIPGVMVINGGEPSFYNMFYDWDVSYSTTCERIPATVEVGLGSVLPAFTPSQILVDLQVDPTVTFTNNSQLATDYLWNFGDGATSTDASPTHTYTLPGTYKVGLSAITANCSAADSAIIEVVGDPLTSNELPAMPGQVQLFPNPTSGWVSVKLDLDLAREVSWVLYDATGRQLAEKSGQRYPQGQFELDLSGRPQGTYFLQLRIDDQVISKQVLKIR